MSDIASQDPKDLAECKHSIAMLMRDYDLKQKFPDVWRHLAELSDETQLDAVDVDPAGVFVKGNTFDGLMTVYLVFRFNTQDGRILSPEALEGEFKGHFDAEGRPQIDSVSVNDSLFYQ